MRTAIHMASHAMPRSARPVFALSIGLEAKRSIIALLPIAIGLSHRFPVQDSGTVMGTETLTPHAKTEPLAFLGNAVFVQAELTCKTTPCVGPGFATVPRRARKYQGALRTARQSQCFSIHSKTAAPSDLAVRSHVVKPLRSFSCPLHEEALCVPAIAEPSTGPTAR